MTYYAIGDIHGMFDKLDQLHLQIFEDIRINNIQNPIIVHLGDYIDRGPDSKKVIDLLQKMEKEQNPRTINLKGNHEQLMIDALNYGGNDYRIWISNGGDATINSYGNQDFLNLQEEIIWMKFLPSSYKDDINKILFIHAGIYPQKFPRLDSIESIWTRNPAFFADQFWHTYGNKELENWLVVHGHSVFSLKEIYNSDRRINLDTGACYGGKLSCAKIEPLPNFKRNVTFFQV